MDTGSLVVVEAQLRALTSRLSMTEAVVELYGDMKVVHYIQIKQLHHCVIVPHSVVRVR